MLRMIGAALLALGIASIGFTCAVKEKRRLYAMECAAQGISLLKSSILHRLMTLEEALHCHASQNALLAALKDAKHKEDALLRFGLPREEAAIFSALLDAIPRAAAGSTAHFDAAQEQLQLRLEAQRRAVGNNGALYPKLGLLCAAAVFLMLI